MKLFIADKVPEPYTTKKGNTYETRYLYTGFGRYNEFEKTLEVIQVEPDESFTFFSRPHTVEVLSRVYHTEAVTLTLYSASPRIWKETVGEDTWFFQEIVQVGPQPSF
jgi:hypothetical protein